MFNTFFVLCLLRFTLFTFFNFFLSYNLVILVYFIFILFFLFGLFISFYICFLSTLLSNTFFHFMCKYFVYYCFKQLELLACALVTLSDTCINRLFIHIQISRKRELKTKHCWRDITFANSTFSRLHITNIIFNISLEKFLGKKKLTVFSGLVKTPKLSSYKLSAICV